MLTVDDISIPEITDEKLVALPARIRPVMPFGKNNKKHYLKPCDLREVACTWHPKKAEEAIDLKFLGDIVTLHEYGHPMLFKPSVAEVLAQIPSHLIDETIAFEIVNKPLSAEDLNKEQRATRAGFHTATVRLYTRS